MRLPERRLGEAALGAGQRTPGLAERAPARWVRSDRRLRRATPPGPRPCSAAPHIPSAARSRSACDRLPERRRAARGEGQIQLVPGMLLRRGTLPPRGPASRRAATAIRTVHMRRQSRPQVSSRAAGALSLRTLRRPAGPAVSVPRVGATGRTVARTQPAFIPTSSALKAAPSAAWRLAGPLASRGRPAASIVSSSDFHESSRGAKHDLGRGEALRQLDHGAGARSAHAARDPAGH